MSAPLFVFFSYAYPSRQVDLFNYTQVNVWTERLKAPPIHKEKIVEKQIMILFKT